MKGRSLASGRFGEALGRASRGCREEHGLPEALLVFGHEFRDRGLARAGSAREDEYARLDALDEGVFLSVGKGDVVIRFVAFEIAGHPFAVLARPFEHAGEFLRDIVLRAEHLTRIDAHIVRIWAHHANPSFKNRIVEDFAYFFAVRVRECPDPCGEILDGQIRVPLEFARFEQRIVDRRADAGGTVVRQTGFHRDGVHFAKTDPLDVAHEPVGILRQYRNGVLAIAI